MIMLRRRMVQVVMAMFLSLGLALAWGKPALASNDELWAEVEAYADLYRVGTDHVMSEGISIGGMEIGGMTLRETVDALRSRQESMKATEVVLVFEGKSVTYTMDQFGLGLDVSGVDIVKAATLGKSGTLLERYKANADIENGGYDILAEQSSHSGKIAAVISKFARQMDVPAIEATITRKSADSIIKSGGSSIGPEMVGPILREQGEFIVTHEEPGVAVNQSRLLEQISEAIENWDGETTITLHAETIVLEPKYTYEALSSISDPLGHYETICGVLDSDRGKNVIAGAKKLDGLVVLPGESLSVVEVLVPFTEANGYHPGVQYGPDGYDIALGGGVCSLSTTLYNALLYAEIDIDKRWNHSMTVSYVPYGFDSTVNDDGSRDLVFTNNYDTPIYIEVYTHDTPDWVDDWLYFNIYGKETRDMKNRELKFYNNVLEIDMPTRDEFTFKEDYTLKPGEEVWVQGNYPYVKVEAWKEVWVNGVLESKELLHTDTYRRSPAIIHYNPTPPPTEEPTEAPTEEPTEAPADESVESADGLIVIYPSGN